MARDSAPQPDVPLLDAQGGVSPHWYDHWLATRQRGVDNTLGLETLQDQLAGKQPLNANLSAIAQLIGSGFLRRDSNGTWSLAGLTPDEMLNPFATYLVDENGDYLVDEDGNFLVSDDGDPVPLENGGTGAALVDPNADRMYFWDDSLGATTWLATGTTLAITGTNIDIASSYVGQTSITTLGTIGTGTWNGTTIAVANGGTGATTPTAALSNLGVSTGTYTPTGTSVANVTAITTYSANWVRVGDMVFVTGLLDIQPTATGFTQLNLTLPIASNFTSGQQAGGTTACAGDPSRAGTVGSDAAADKMLLSFTTATTANNTSSFGCMYQVI